MIHWAWLLLIVPAAACAGFFVAALFGATRASWLRRMVTEAQEERRKFADMLRKKCLEVEQLKRVAKRKK